MSSRGPAARSSNTDNSSALPPVARFQATNVTLKKPTSARGGGLRIGKVITEARAVVNPAKHSADPGGRKSSASSAGRFVDGDETRVQDEIIEMLTTRLAKKEKETELLRLQQDRFDAQRQQFESQIAQLERDLTDANATLVPKLELLQREAQQAQLQIDRFRTDAESQRVLVLETKRQREREAEVARSKTFHLERQVDELRRELGCLRMEKETLENRVVAGVQQLDVARERFARSESRCAELEAALAQNQQAVIELAQQLEIARGASTSQNEVNQKLEQEKQVLEDKVQQLSRNLRDLASRANDAERRKSDLCQAETHLTKQLTQLHRENEELKARNGQLQAQAKQQQVRLASIEAGKAASDAKLKDASEEVDQARKRLREHQFRVQQLQEELTFLNKKKPSEKQPLVLPTSSTPTETTTGTSVPSWMLN